MLDANEMVCGGMRGTSSMMSLLLKKEKFIKKQKKQKKTKKNLKIKVFFCFVVIKIFL